MTLLRWRAAVGCALAGGSLLAAGGLPVRAAGPTPLIEYRFNTQTANQVANEGSLADAPVTMYTAAGVATSLLGADGSGVSGQPGDRALDLTAAPGMGNLGGSGPYADAGDVDGVDGLTSFTLSGWFRTPAGVPGSGGATLLADTTSSAGFRLAFTATGQLSLYVNSATPASITGSLYSATDRWVFFAVSYGSQSVAGSTNNVKFYAGDATTPVALVGQGTVGAGNVASNSNPLRIGNSGTNTSPGTSRPFDGLLDDIRIYGATGSADGMVSLADLDAQRQFDLGLTVEIPEPGTLPLVATVGAPVLIVAVLSRRRRRRAPGRAPSRADASRGRG
jgi:hypothetical protein